MNIFATDPCPIKSARFLDFKRQNKMLLESCQLMSTAIHLHGGKAPYKPTHIKHPVNIWTRQNRSNFMWVYQHALELSKIYTEKTGKIHKCSLILNTLLEQSSVIPDGELTPFVNCARNASLNLDFTYFNNVHEAYKQYLLKKWEIEKNKKNA